MKIRNGFVSNSSSSSFVVCMPKEIKFTDELKEYLEEESYGDYEITEEKFNEVIKQFLEDGYICEYDEYENYSIIKNLCRYYDSIISSIDSGPDCGMVQLLKENEINKIKKFI